MGAVISLPNEGFEARSQLSLFEERLNTLHSVDQLFELSESIHLFLDNPKLEEEIKVKGILLVQKLENERKGLLDQEQIDLESIQLIDFELDRLGRELSFIAPSESERRLQELAQELEYLTLRKKGLSEEIDRELKKVFTHLTDIHLEISFPILTELKRNAYFPNFFQFMMNVKKDFKRNPEKALKDFSSLTAEQQGSILSFSTSHEKAIEAFLEHLEEQKSDLKQLIYSLETFAVKEHLKKYLWRMGRQESNEKKDLIQAYLMYLEDQILG